MNLPTILNTEECIVGIDEAGRGPVIGPMVYAAALWPISLTKEYEAIGAKDSKTLSLQQREKILEELMEKEEFGYSYKVLDAKFISSSMLGITKYNLNDLSHDTVIDMLNEILAAGVNVKGIYVDTVGDPEKYRMKIQGRLRKPIKVVVSKKADSIYPVVSAASIVAKVNRDHLIDPMWGSGYPADPNTVKWLNSNIDNVFGFPQHVRFSWATCTKLMDENCVKVDWKPTPKSMDTSLFCSLGFSSCE